MSKQMGRLILTRGLPGSGKTTKAVRYVMEDPQNRVHISRDDLRHTVFGDTAPVLDYARETDLTALQQQMAEWSLKMGKHVVIDDLNLRQKYAREWANLAARLGAEFEVWDMTDVPLEDCIAHDLDRKKMGGRYVGARVINEMYSKFLAARGLEPVVADEAMTFTKYVPDWSLPEAYVIDVDGTVAHMTGRNPFDYSRVKEDEPDKVMLDLLQTLDSVSPKYFLYLSGRENTGNCYQDTLAWLTHNGFPVDMLVLRSEGDHRDDTIVKSEMFDTYVAPVYNARAVFDDRNKVVKMWRDKGLKVLQVADGNF